MNEYVWVQAELLRVEGYMYFDLHFEIYSSMTNVMY